MFVKKAHRRLLNNQNFNKWLGFFIALIIVGTTILVSNNLVRQLRNEEHKKVETIVEALQLQSSGNEVSDQARGFALKILQENSTIPLILVDEDGAFLYQKNLDKIADKLETDSIFLKNHLEELEKKHAPIQVNLPFGVQEIYYQNSNLLMKLRYYPLVLIGIIILFFVFVFWYFRMLDSSYKSFLWAGMAKETAHQIGTPLTSLLGWLEILKLENIDKAIVDEMNNDVERLNQIAMRFSKIGSVPELKKTNVVEVVESTFNYLKKRISSKISFEFNAEKPQMFALANSELLSWVLENIVKNAVDAMQSRGSIKLNVIEDKVKIIIKIKDSGPGIPSGKLHRIFEPGFTTKKRGWGLGLSLAKRIIKEYHNGKIYVEYSDKNRGTQFCIELLKIDK
ncbi:HAMP domain-containing histidine kinase [Weeksellaceae bacterium TAE3-ERU29]|nr:HAMP domain-containing histidine kinase [Weeksellaceae bacterium TAE3-ERU29]